MTQEVNSFKIIPPRGFFANTVHTLSSPSVRKSMMALGRSYSYQRQRQTITSGMPEWDMGNITGVGCPNFESVCRQAILHGLSTVKLNIGLSNPDQPVAVSISGHSIECNLPSLNIESPANGWEKDSAERAAHIDKWQGIFNGMTDMNSPFSQALLVRQVKLDEDSGLVFYSRGIEPSSFQDRNKLKDEAAKKVTAFFDAIKHFSKSKGIKEFFLIAGTTNTLFYQGINEAEGRIPPAFLYLVSDGLTKDNIWLRLLLALQSSEVF